MADILLVHGAWDGGWCRQEMDDLVLVCHSYGGVPGVGAADQRAGRCRSLVLLDAMLPIDGLSSNEMRDLVGPALPPISPNRSPFRHPMPRSSGSRGHRHTGSTVSSPRTHSASSPSPSGSPERSVRSA